jgi:hypothetical protein
MTQFDPYAPSVVPPAAGLSMSNDGIAIIENKKNESSNPPPASAAAPPQLLDFDNLQQHQHNQQQPEKVSNEQDALYAASQQNTAVHTNNISPHAYLSSSAASIASSVASHSTSNSTSRHSTQASGGRGGAHSIFKDKKIAPPPKMPESLQAIRSRAHPADLSTLPPFDLVQHSGECLARFSLKSIIIKKWRPTFWISLGDAQLLFFRSKNDFEEWISNPYLKEKDRTKLIKFSIDFANDVYQGVVQGYSVSTLSAKEYSRDGYMYHFKLEKWDQYGPSIHFALGGKSEHEVRSLRSIMKAMIELSSPQDLHHIPSGGVGEASYHSDYSAASSSMHSTRSSGSMSRGHNRHIEKGDGEEAYLRHYDHEDTVIMMKGGEEVREGRATRLGSSGLRGILRSKSREPTIAGQNGRQEKHGEYDTAMISPTSSISSGLGANKSILKKVFKRNQSDIEIPTANEEFYHGGGSISSPTSHRSQQQQEYRYRHAEIDYGM